MAVSWNPWHGCRKISSGCTNCYVYRMDDRHGRNGGEIFRTAAFTLPVRRKRNGAYFIPPGEEVDLCFTSDFLLEDADLWRPEVWQMIRCRQDLSFFFITKRIHRLTECIPADWGKGYPNVAIGCTVENQSMADFRLPIFFRMPVMKKLIICAPLLECIDLTPYLGDWVNLGYRQEENPGRKRDSASMNGSRQSADSAKKQMWLFVSGRRARAW